MHSLIHPSIHPCIEALVLRSLISLNLYSNRREIEHIQVIRKKIISGNDTKKVRWGNEERQRGVVERKLHFRILGKLSQRTGEINQYLKDDKGPVRKRSEAEPSR